jgi:hypothetical protein
VAIALAHFGGQGILEYSRRMALPCFLKRCNYRGVKKGSLSQRERLEAVFAGNTINPEDVPLANIIAMHEEARRQNGVARMER